MKPIARKSDRHLCMVADPKPHVGGPILSGVETVLAGDLPVATQGGRCFCNGPPDRIVQGSETVLAEDQPLSRVGDRTAHGGIIVAGDASVRVG